MLVQYMHYFFYWKIDGHIEARNKFVNEGRPLYVANNDIYTEMT
jgi:hypothetical protein